MTVNFIKELSTVGNFTVELTKMLSDCNSLLFLSMSNPLNQMRPPAAGMGLQRL